MQVMPSSRARLTTAMAVGSSQRRRSASPPSPQSRPSSSAPSPMKLTVSPVRPRARGSMVAVAMGTDASCEKVYGERWLKWPTPEVRAERRTRSDENRPGGTDRRVGPRAARDRAPAGGIDPCSAGQTGPGSRPAELLDLLVGPAALVVVELVDPEILVAGVVVVGGEAGGGRADPVHHGDAEESGRRRPLGQDGPVEVGEG